MRELYRVPSISKVLQAIASHPLAGKRPAAAMGRFIAWQLRSRLARGPVIHSWVNGSQFLVRRGETGLTGNIYMGLHEFADMAFVAHYLRPDDLFVDVGANAGSYTLLSGSVAGAKVIAFEPIPETSARLRANVALNQLEARVKVFQNAVGDRSQTLRMTIAGDTLNRVILGETTVGATGTDVSVEVVRLDDILHGEAVVVMKIDVEGFELPVLRGATHVLDTQSLEAIIVELNGSGTQYGFQECEAERILAQHGFVPASYDPWTRTVSFLGTRSASEGNALYVRDCGSATKRCQSGQVLDVYGVRV
jgi:FkbM family methyltransferase